MKLKHMMKMYPPRVKMTVRINSSLNNHTLPVTFVGCQSDDLDVQLMFPLPSPGPNHPPPPIMALCKVASVLAMNTIKLLQHVYIVHI